MHGKGSMRYADGRVYCGKMQAAPTPIFSLYAPPYSNFAP